MVTVTSAEAQNKFGQLLDTAQREPVLITRHGRHVAFLVSSQDMEEWLSVRNKRKSAVEAFEAWSEMARGQTKPAAAELTEEEIVRMVHELRDTTAT